MKRSLDSLLSPRSVAVVGVSSRPDSLSGRLLANLAGRGFAGPIYPINPKADEIQSRQAYPSVGSVPGEIDLAVVMVPRDAVLAAVDDCIAKQVGGVVVITAGFREAGESGAGVERELVRRLRERGVRMVGPNCMGVINTAPEVRLDATFSPIGARRAPWPSPPTLGRWAWRCWRPHARWAWRSPGSFLSGTVPMSPCATCSSLGRRTGGRGDHALSRGH